MDRFAMASIEKLPSGKFRVKWRTPDNRQNSKAFRAKADADAFRRQIERELDEGLVITNADRTLTVGEYVTRDGGWLETRRWKASTRDSFESHWRCHLAPRWAATPMVSIRPSTVQGWINDLEAAGLAPTSVEALYRRVVAILNSAHRDGIISRQPVSRLALPPRGNADRVHVPTPQEVQAIADAMGERYRTLVWTCAILGLRPAEAIGLTIERVDFLNRTVTIDRQLVTPARGQPHFTGLKTQRNPSRELPAPPRLIEELASHIARFEPMKLEAPAQHGGTGRLIFTNNEGRPIRRSGFGYVWNQAASQIELRPELRGWHSLRHFAITSLIASGTNPDFVRQFAGHSRLSETLDTYNGFWPQDEDHTRQLRWGEDFIEQVGAICPPVALGNIRSRQVQ
jgi:integrase